MKPKFAAVAALILLAVGAALILRTLPDARAEREFGQLRDLLETKGTQASPAELADAFSGIAGIGDDRLLELVEKNVRSEDPLRRSAALQIVGGLPHIPDRLPTAGLTSEAFEAEISSALQAKESVERGSGIFAAQGLASIEPHRAALEVIAERDTDHVLRELARATLDGLHR